MAGKKQTDSVPTPAQIKAGNRKKQAEVVLKNNADISKLSPKQQKLVTAIVADPEKPFVQHCREVGYKVGPNSRASLIKNRISGALGATLAEVGIFEIDIGHAIAQGMNADKLLPAKRPIRNKDGKVIGEEIKMICVPDHKVRFLFTKLAIDLGGYRAAIQHEIKGKVDHVHSPGRRIMDVLEQLSPEDLDRNIREREKRIDADFEVEDEECAA